MSLDTAKLEKVRELASGVLQARCPACAEDGGDRKAEHLRVYADGRYGCCVHPKDGTTGNGFSRWPVIGNPARSL
jgi:hypothetical protein